VTEHEDRALPSIEAIDRRGDPGAALARQQAMFRIGRCARCHQ